MESKLAEGKSLPWPCSKFIEPGKTLCIDKKMEYLKKKRDWKNNTLATRNNVNAVEGDEKKQNN